MSAKITVGITAYREGEWLRQCWNSVLAQKCSDWDAIVVLDGGADSATERIFNELSHPRLKKIKCHENIGPYPTRELMFEHSAHDIILHSDADDYFLPNAVEVTLRMYRDESIRWIGLGGQLLYEDGTIRDCPGRRTDIEHLLMEYWFPGYLLFRRSVWLELGRYDIELARGHADVDFCLKILRKGLRGEITSELCHVKREHKSSVSHTDVYCGQIHRFHERIVQNHPDVFKDTHLRERFLVSGFLCSSWSLMRLGQFEEAGEVARKYVCLRGMRAVWPINWAGKLPDAVVRGLLAGRLAVGRFSRALRRLYRRLRPNDGAGFTR
jgi:glycosyltransferase involved in cell wall biosynthesis